MFGFSSKKKAKEEKPKIQGQDDKRKKLEEALKKAVRSFGVGLEVTVEEIIQIYRDSNFPVEDKHLQYLAHEVRKCIDDRGWGLGKHLDTIETYLIENIPKTESFPEPLFFSENKPTYEIRSTSYVDSDKQCSYEISMEVLGIPPEINIEVAAIIEKARRKIDEEIYKLCMVPSHLLKEKK